MWWVGEPGDYSFGFVLCRCGVVFCSPFGGGSVVHRPPPALRFVVVERCCHGGDHVEAICDHDGLSEREVSWGSNFVPPVFVMGLELYRSLGIMSNEIE
jgi:hypothetical protein